MSKKLTIKNVQSVSVADKKYQQHGWTIPLDTVSGYADACLNASENDEHFKNFKKNEAYRPILEGAAKGLFDTYFQHIKDLECSNLFFDNLEKFRINDSLGNPDLYEDSKIGKFSGSTLKFAFNAIEIVDFINSKGCGIDNIKNIVEIGGGYGGLCLILSGFIDFDSYVLVDLPEVCKLIEKYVQQFPQLEGKVKTIPCNEVNENTFNSIDLCIAINSLSECNLETQMSYFANMISKSNYGYLVRNPDTAERWNEHLTTINSLDDTFLVDDSERVERHYSNQTIVYIMKEKN